MIPADYHIHTSRCGHAQGDVWQYVDSAVKKGFSEIGFADHAPMYWLPASERDPEIAMQDWELGEYISEVQEVATTNPHLTIRVGIELDYILGYEKDAMAVLKDRPFDYVIGSVHFIDGWSFDHPAYIDEYKHRNIDEIYRRYFNLLSQAALSGMFDIMAHPDLIKKFGYYPNVCLEDFYHQAARSFAAGGVSVEVNTAGLRWNSKEIYPSLQFLKICHEEGVTASVGSDAHSPEQVGFAFAEAEELLIAAGYSEVALFEKRNRMMIKL